jgi:hypothetical protein
MYRLPNPYSYETIPPFIALTVEQGPGKNRLGKTAFDPHLTHQGL